MGVCSALEFVLRRNRSNPLFKETIRFTAFHNQCGGIIVRQQIFHRTPNNDSFALLRGIETNTQWDIHDDIRRFLKKRRAQQRIAKDDRPCINFGIDAAVFHIFSMMNDRINDNLSFFQPFDKVAS